MKQHWTFPSSTEGSSTVGVFSIISMTITTPNLLLAMVAPVLYNRWSKADARVHPSTLTRAALRGALVFQVCGLAVVPVLPWLVDSILGSGYAAAAPRIAILICALTPLAFSRVAAPLLQARGGTASVTAAWGCRLAACVVLLPLATFHVLAPLDYGVACLLVGEYAALVPIVAGLRRLQPAHV